MCLGMPPTKPTKRHIFLFVEIAHSFVGLLVTGGISEILLINEEMIQPAPNITPQIAKKFMSGVIAADGRMISLISLHAIMPPSEQSFVA
jgi:purine-binding chemotaxis protein CheW